jgi:hypothetical protein
MHRVKAGGVAMQHGNEVDHGLVALHGAGQGSSVVHIHLQHRQAGQHLHALGVLALAGGHSNLPASANQLFTHMGTDKTGATEDEDGCHGGVLLGSGWV